MRRLRMENGRVYADDADAVKDALDDAAEWDDEDTDDAEDDE